MALAGKGRVVRDETKSKGEITVRYSPFSLFDAECENLCRSRNVLLGEAAQLFKSRCIFDRHI
jgi:hypothetical protein